jgi:hypothetical protein
MLRVTDGAKSERCGAPAGCSADSGMADMGRTGPAAGFGSLVDRVSDAANAADGAAGAGGNAERAGAPPAAVRGASASMAGARRRRGG